MTIDDELLELGEEYAKKEQILVDEWKKQRPNFVGFAEVNSPELKKLRQERKEKFAEILKKYNKINSSD